MTVLRALGGLILGLGVFAGLLYLLLVANITQRLEDAGFTVVRFGLGLSSWQSKMDEYAWVFGQGKLAVID